METIVYLRYVAALLFILGLIAGMAVLLRRFGAERHLSAAKGKKRRLDVLEVLPLGPKHRLLLVRRDRVAHVLMLSQDEAVVVERGVPLEQDTEYDHEKSRPS